MLDLPYRAISLAIKIARYDRFYYLWVAYETKLQMVAELTGHMSKATVKYENDVMLHKATNSLSKRVRTYLRESCGQSEQQK